MRYYYGQLSRPLQGVYDALLGGFLALAPGIRIPMLDEKQLADVYLRLKLDEPLLFYVTGYRSFCRSICLTKQKFARTSRRSVHVWPG